MKIVCIGDSLTEGYLINLKKRWTSELMRETGIEVINSGICGDTTGGMLTRFKKMVLDHKPTHVIIMGGTNDVFMGMGIEIIKSNIHVMTRYAKYHGIIAIIGIPTPCVEDSFEIEIYEKINLMRESLKEYALEDGLQTIDFGKNILNEDFLDDGCHPNEIGHYKMMKEAEKLITSI